MPTLEVKAATLSPINASAAAFQAVRSRESARQIREVIREQGRALEESCEKGAIRDTLLAASWHRVNLWLGLSSVITAALAAFVAGKGEALLQLMPHHGAEIAAVFALISAILTSTLTFLAPSEKAGAYYHFSNKLRSLRDRVRSFVEIDCALGSKDAALCDKFARMVRERSEIDSSHPIVPNWAYDRAYVEMKKKIEHKQFLKRVSALEAPNTGRGETSLPAIVQ
jgi:hypothetical protein